MPPIHALLQASFVAVALAATALRLWLAHRQQLAVASHRHAVPEPFADSITLADHQKAADYTLAGLRHGRRVVLLDLAVLLALTVGGGIGWIDHSWQQSGLANPWRGALVIATVALVTGAIELPLSVWRTFRIEAAFGFNRTTPRIFLTDLLKSLTLAVALGGPIVLGALTLMDRTGTLWWVWVWAGWVALILLMTWAWPALIAPLFNRFSPLDDPALRERIDALLQRCGFSSNGVFVVDGSRRSAHGNAYFTGIGTHKRIVFYDTLLERLTPPELEGVLAHELGHFRLRHVRSRLLVSLAGSFAALGLLGWLAAQPDFYATFAVSTPSSHTALLLFMFVAPVFSFFATPLGSLWSRRHEFEADAFAAQRADARDLATALVKLYRDNASTLTPDAVYSAFYYSHPPATERIARLRRDVVQVDRLSNPLQGPVGV